MYINRFRGKMQEGVGIFKYFLIRGKFFLSANPGGQILPRSFYFPSGFRILLL